MSDRIVRAVVSLCALAFVAGQTVAQEANSKAPVEAGLQADVEAPAGAALEVRLADPVSSFRSKKGDVIHAVLIAPVMQGGSEVLPSGLTLKGRVLAAKRVGLGVIRDQARLRLQFDSITLPGGDSLPLESKVSEIENSREKLLADGTIVGIRATDSYGHQATGMISSVSAFDPMLFLFSFAASSAVLRFPEAEITYPSGTELRIELLKPIVVPNAVLEAASHAEEVAATHTSLELFINELPYRTRTTGKSIPSDLTNLIFLGSREDLLQAFAAAGWTRADIRDSATSYKTVRALAESRGYADAPVSTLKLDGKPPAFVFEKTLNTISKRHHLRVWEVAEKWEGQTVWTAAATHDIGLGISANKNLIHRIDPKIDDERDKVADDLRFAKCATSTELVDRPRVPRVAHNATHERMTTDGRVAVLQLNACVTQSENGVTPARHEKAQYTANPIYRGVRQFDLTLRNTLIRDNIAWQAYSAGRMIWKIKHRHAEPREPSNSFLPETETEEGEARLGLADAANPMQSFREKVRPHLPEVALSLNGGESYRRHLGDLFLASVDPTTGIESIYQFPMRLEPGAMLGWSATVHPSGLVSHKIYFETLQANLLTGEDPNIQVDRMKMRTAGYQAEINLVPRRWRLRPFVSGGGSLTSYKFKNIKLPKRDGVFRYGLRRVGTVVSAFNSAGVAPLDGGSVFRVSATYGGGLKLRVTRLLELQLEYRESFAQDPDFYNKQSVNLSSQGITSTQDRRSNRHSMALISLSFTP